MANISRDAFKNLRAKLNQYQATTGRPISDRVMRNLLEADLSAEYGKSLQREEFALRKREAEDRRKAMEAEAGAAGVSGVVQLGTSAAQLYMLRNQLKGTGGAGTGASTGGTGTAPLAPNANVTAAGVSGSGGVYGGNAAAFDATTGEFTAEYMAAEGGTSLGTAGTAGSTSASAGTAGTTGTTSGGVMATAAPYAAAAGVGYASGKTFGTWARHNEDSWGQITPWGGKKTEGQFAGGIGGVGLGFMMGGPVGAVIGGIVGAVSGGGDSVICTELHRQGYISKKVLDLDGQHRLKYIEPVVYLGYLRWAEPVVRAMQKSKLVTTLVAPFGKAWAYEMAHRMNPEIKGTILGKVLMKVGVPICRIIGRRARG